MIFGMKSKVGEYIGVASKGSRAWPKCVEVKLRRMCPESDCIAWPIMLWNHDSMKSILGRSRMSLSLVE
jgi:hypothetical protein